MMINSKLGSGYLEKMYGAGIPAIDMPVFRLLTERMTMKYTSIRK